LQSLIDSVEACRYKAIQAMRLTLALNARHLREVAVDHARLRTTLGRSMQRVDELDYRLRDSMRHRLGKTVRTVDTLVHRLRQRDVRLRFAEARRRCEAADATLRQWIRWRLSEVKGTLRPLDAQLAGLSPLKILDRGY